MKSNLEIAKQPSTEPSKGRSWAGSAIMAIPPIMVLLALAVVSLVNDKKVAMDQLNAAQDQVEALIQLRLQAKADYLVLLAEELSVGHMDEPLFQERISRFVTNHPYLINVTWADRDFVIRWTAPYEPNKQVIGLSLSLAEPKRASHEAAATRKPIWTQPFEIIQGKAAIEVYVPVFKGDEFLGTLGGVHSIRGILIDLLPAELLDQYRIVFADSKDRQYGFDSQARLLDGDLTQTSRLQLAGSDVSLVVTAYESETHWSLLGLIVFCIFLIIGMAFSTRSLNQRLNEQILAEVNLIESEKRARALLDANPDLVFRLNREGVYLDYKAARSELFVQSPVPIIGKSNSDLLAPELADLFDQKIKLALDSGETQTFEYQLPIPERGQIDYQARVVKSGDDEVIATIKDITERKQVEYALRESENKYRTLFELSADAILIIEGDKFVDCNLATVKMLGYSTKKELLEIHPSQLSPETQPDGQSSFVKANKMMSMAFDQGSHRFEWDHVRYDGTVFPVEVLLTAVPFRGKTFLHVVWRDITDRKRLEALESRAIRLETAGTIAGQVAHDFNNLLAPMMAYPEFIREKLPKDHPSQKYLNKIENAAQQIAEINQQLLTLGRRGHYNHEPININTIINQAVKEIVPQAKNISWEIDLNPDLMNILGGGSQIHRVVTNLLYNAVDAIPEVGLISVRTENYYADDVSGAYGRVPKGEYVKLTISDSGSGIADDIVQKILDPFFTTKTSDRKRGSGLGMSVVDSVVKDHDGYLDLKTQFGEGTSFYLYFPTTRKSLEENQDDETRGGSETILVVDDDDTQRDVSSQLLKKLGYQVNTIESGEKAIEFLRENSQDLVILDMVMPGGIDGTKTYERVLEINPNQKAIIVSGFSESDRVRVAMALGAGAFVKKPLTRKTIAAAVRTELDRKRDVITSRKT